MARPKLPLDRPFVLADTQIHTEDRIFSQDRQNPRKSSYYPTGKYGAGTEGYNSGLTVLGSDEHWLLDGNLSHKNHPRPQAIIKE